MISSATIDQKKFVETFRHAGFSTTLLEIENKKPVRYFGPHYWKSVDVYPGCGCWLCALGEAERKTFWQQFPDNIGEGDLPEITTDFVQELCQRTDRGSVFVFLHGKYAIEKTAQRLAKALSDLEMVIVPIYSTLGDREVKDRLKRTEGKRRVIVATNIGETSVTLADVVYVVDSGFIKEATWDSPTRSTVLRPKRHSQDGCRQRWGRAGRVQEGFAYTLFTEDEFRTFEEHTAPEISRTCAEDLLVTAKAAGLSDAASIPWMDPPDKEELVRAGAAIAAAGLCDSDGDLDPKALELMRIPRPAAEAALFAAADLFGCLVEALSVLLLFRSRDGEMRLGENRYLAESALFLWDKDWSLKDKNQAARVHEAMRAGCQDDVALLAKLLYGYQAAKDASSELEWTARHYLSGDLLDSVLRDRDDLLRRTFGESTHEDRWVIKWERLKVLRHLIRSLLPNTGLDVVAEGKECADSPEILASTCLLYPDDWVEIKEQEGEVTVSERGLGQPLAPRIVGQWLGSGRANPGRVIALTDGKGGLVALLSPFSDEETIRAFQGLMERELTVSIIGRFQDPFGKGGWVQCVDTAGHVSLIPFEELSLLPGALGFETVDSGALTVSVCAWGEDCAILSLLPRVIADLKSFRIPGGSQTLSGFVGDPDDHGNVIVIVPSGDDAPHRFFHSFVVDWNKPRGQSRPVLRQLEEVIVRIRSESMRCRIRQTLTAAESELLPSRFTYDEKTFPSGEKTGTLSFPCALDRTALTDLKVPAEIKNRIWRTSWRCAFSAEIVQLKSRMTELEPGMPITGTITRVRIDEQTKTLKAIDVVHDNGVKGLVPSRQIGERLKLEKGARVDLDVWKVDAEKGLVFLTAEIQDAYRALRIGSRVYGVVYSIAERKDGQIAGVRVSLLVNTERGQQEALGFLPCRHLHRSPGTVRPNVPAVGTAVNVEVLEISAFGGSQPNLVVRQV